MDDYFVTMNVFFAFFDHCPSSGALYTNINTPFKPNKTQNYVSVAKSVFRFVLVAAALVRLVN